MVLVTRRALNCIPQTQKPLCGVCQYTGLALLANQTDWKRICANVLFKLMRRTALSYRPKPKPQAVPSMICKAVFGMATSQGPEEAPHGIGIKVQCGKLYLSSAESLKATKILSLKGGHTFFGATFRHNYFSRLLTERRRKLLHGHGNCRPAKAANAALLVEFQLNIDDEDGRVPSWRKSTKETDS